MNASKWFRSAKALRFAGLLLCAAPAAGADSEVALTALFGDGQPLPTERLTSALSGRENRLRLSWRRSDPGLLPQLTASAALRLELALDEPVPSQLGARLRDGSSWVRIEWSSGPAARLSLRAFPFDTDYERLGYLHALDWGGSDRASGESIYLAQQGGVPGLELAFAAARSELSVGVRWATAPAGLAGEQRLWGALLRGSLEPSASVRADFGLGYFQRAAFDQALGGSPSFVEGASLRLVWRRGPREPELGTEPFRAPALRDAASLLAAPAARGAALALEGVALASRVRRFEAPSVTSLSLAPAAALYGSLRGAVLAGHAALSWRSLPFVQRNQAGLLRGETVPITARAQSELAIWAGLGAETNYHLSPSLELGLLLPAALETPSALPGYTQTFVVRETGEVSALPVGSRRLPIAAGRAGLRFQVSAAVSLCGFVDYEREPNRVRLVSTASGAQRTFEAPGRLGGGAALQARF